MAVLIGNMEVVRTPFPRALVRVEWVGIYKAIRRVLVR